MHRSSVECNRPHCSLIVRTTSFRKATPHNITDRCLDMDSFVARDPGGGGLCSSKKFSRVLFEG
eukprot:m.188350 g.188350  ORF g.188350 m.188350 type:complete len:64 (+) comp18527_c0_seq1:2365-2556(+)